MFKYFSIRFLILLVAFVVIVSVCFITFEYSNNKIWFRGFTNWELFEMSWESYKVFAKGVITSNDWGEFDAVNSVWQKGLIEIPTTFKIITYTFIAFISLGTFLGIFTAYYEGTWIDKVVSYIAILFGSIPEYVTIGILVFIFGVTLGWLPTFYDPNPDNVLNLFAVIALPVAALSMVPILKIMRLLRSELVEQMNSEYILLVRCKGFKRLYIMLRHALRNSISPVLTEIPYIFGLVISLSFVIEIAYNIRGVGYLFYNSVIKVGEISYILVNIPISVLIAAYYVLSVMVVAYLCNVLMVIIDPSIILNSKKTKSFHQVD